MEMERDAPSDDVEKVRLGPAHDTPSCLVHILLGHALAGLGGDAEGGEDLALGRGEVGAGDEAHGADVRLGGGVLPDGEGYGGDLHMHREGRVSMV